MKIDVGHSTVLKSKAAITIQSDYPWPLIAADSMSQSGMCIINQWLLFASPPLSLLLPLFLWAIFNVKQGYRLFPAVQVNAPPKAYKTMCVLLLTKHHWLVMNTLRDLTNSPFLHLSSLHIIANTHLRQGQLTTKNTLISTWEQFLKQYNLCSFLLIMLLNSF